jgi:phosphoribosyl-dephospho-CoA transferase
MVPLHRHQIAWLSESGWRRVQQRAWDAPVRDCIAHWAAKPLPLVVTRQDMVAGEDTIALGLPAPGRWDRRRLAITVPRNEVLYFDEFPLASHLVRVLAASARPAWHRLCADLAKAKINTRVYGSHGWQLLSGLDHVRAGSDIDLWLSVSNDAQADAAAGCLQAASHAAPEALPRLDGELMFDDGAAVAWREWLTWRAGRVKSLLVKTLCGSTVVRSRDWHGTAAWAEAA